MPDNRGYLLPNERRMLLRRFAPVLILFPEDPSQPPYVDDGDAFYLMRGAYHPRAADVFVKLADVCFRRRRAARWLSKRGIIRNKAAKADEIISQINAERIRESDVDQAVSWMNDDPRYAGLSSAELRAAAREHLVQEQFSRMVEGFDLPRPWDQNLGHWHDYFALLGEMDPQTRRSVVYGRLVQGAWSLEADLDEIAGLLKLKRLSGPFNVSRKNVALQYWFHYYYDDWANRHEGDWEGITILLELSENTLKQARELGEAEVLDGVRVQDVGYASHEQGYRRRWEDVLKTREGRPIVYVARGSNASYFAWRLEGYEPSTWWRVTEISFGLLGALLGHRRWFGRRLDMDIRVQLTGIDPKNRDWVAADPDPEDRRDDEFSDSYERLIPFSLRGVRRQPGFGREAGMDDATYYLETDDLFWLEMVQEFGVQWGEDGPYPGTKGPKGERGAIQHLRLENVTQQLSQLNSLVLRALRTLKDTTKVSTKDAIPELSAALAGLRPINLQTEKLFPRVIQAHVYTMWALLLRSHPEAWPGGPGLISRWHMWRRGRSRTEWTQIGQDPIFCLTWFLAQVRYELRRVEREKRGRKWDNPFVWTRDTCVPDQVISSVSRSTEKEIPESLERIDQEIYYRDWSGRE